MLIPRRVLICGGRKLAEATVERWLDEHADRVLGPVAVVIHGNAPGADRAGGRWAKRQGIPVEAYPADWDRHGDAAGMIRNRTMYRDGKPDVVLAFPGGNGTKGMKGVARKGGTPVIEVTL